MIELHLCLRTHSRRTRSLITAFQSLARLAGLDRGCLEAHVFAECNDPRRLCYSELWDAEENLRSMLRSKHFTHLMELMEMAAEPPSLDFRTIAETQGLEFARQARQGQNDWPTGEAKPFSFDQVTRSDHSPGVQRQTPDPPPAEQFHSP